jgi:heptosyltransferase-2
MRAAPERVLVRGVNWVGDAVMTLPALGAIRRALPDAHIALLVKPSVAALFEGSPHVDEVIPYSERYDGVLGRLALTRDLRRRRFGRAILLQNAFDAALIAKLAGIPHRTGYDRDGRGFLLTERIAYSGEDRRMHHVEYFLELLRRSGIPAETVTPWLRLSLEERLKARDALSSLRRPLIGLNPGAAYGNAKQWPPERFAGVARHVIEQMGGSAIVFGGAREEAIARKIMNRLRGPFGPQQLRSLAGRTTLRELACLIAECDALVSNDSGPMHIGYAVRTPLVAIFGSTDPALTGPPGAPGNAVLKKIVDCSPCFERECRAQHLRCMDAISVEEVVSALSSLMPRERAVFFDRDGTLCRDADFLSRWDDFHEFEDIGEIGRLRERGLRLVGATNQSGIARGIVEESFVREMNRHYMEKHGFAAFYYCPHGPDDRCACRKPEPGMLLRARAEQGIDLRRSYMVGDNERDFIAARAVGARSVLVQTGKLQSSSHADHTSPNLADAVRWIMEDSAA